MIARTSLTHRIAFEDESRSSINHPQRIHKSFFRIAWLHFVIHFFRSKRFV